MIVTRNNTETPTDLILNLIQTDYVVVFILSIHTSHTPKTVRCSCVTV